MIIPEGYNSYNILSIDPGSVNTGIAIISIENDMIRSIDARTIEPMKLKDRVGYDVDFQPEKLIRLSNLAHTFIDIVDRYKPIAVACESPFYNRRFPMAYGTLLTILNNFQMALAQYNQTIPFRTIEPRVVKSAVGAISIIGKDPVRDAVSKIPSIMNTLIPPLHSLDEHSIDAIAVGYAYLKSLGLRT